MVTLTTAPAALARCNTMEKIDRQQRLDDGIASLVQQYSRLLKSAHVGSRRATRLLKHEAAPRNCASAAAARSASLAVDDSRV